MGLGDGQAVNGQGVGGGGRWEGHCAGAAILLPDGHAGTAANDACQIGA